MGSKPIANKYHEGKVKRTLKRELKVPELAERKADGTSVAWSDCCVLRGLPMSSAQAVAWVLNLPCVVLLPLSVIDGVVVRTTLFIRISKLRLREVVEWNSPLSR